MTSGQAATLAGVPARTFRRYIKTGKVKAKQHPITGRWVVAYEDVQALMTKHNLVTPPPPAKPSRVKKVDTARAAMLQLIKDCDERHDDWGEEGLSRTLGRLTDADDIAYFREEDHPTVRAFQALSWSEQQILAREALGAAPLHGTLTWKKGGPSYNDLACALNDFEIKVYQRPGPGSNFILSRFDLVEEELKRIEEGR